MHELMPKQLSHTTRAIPDFSQSNSILTKLSAARRVRDADEGPTRGEISCMAEKGLTPERLHPISILL